MNVKVVAIVQARMGSARLPNKTMLWLHGFPVIDWVRVRLSFSVNLHQVVFAIPNTKRDSLLQHYLLSKGSTVFAGSEDDVVSRIYLAAKKYEADVVVRICADNPFLCPVEIDRLITFFLNGDYDYAYNHIPRNNKYPDGLGAEVTSMKVLQKIYDNASAGNQREHLFNYILDHPSAFVVGTFDPVNRKLHKPDIRLDLDSYEDYERLLKLKVSIDSDAVDIVQEFESNKNEAV